MAACHGFGVRGEAVQTTSDHAIGTARPKADEQWYTFPDSERDAGPPVRTLTLEWLLETPHGSLTYRLLTRTADC